MRRDRGDRQGEHYRRDRGVDFLIVLDLPVSEIEEGLPADVTPRGREAAEQVVAIEVDRPVEVAFGGVENQAEERIGGRAGAVTGARGEIRPVGRADLGVTEAVRGGAELDRHERVPGRRLVE